MRVIINPKYKDAEAYIRFMPERFVIPGEGVLIDERRNFSKIFSTEWGDWVVKSYKKPVLFQRFIYTFIRKTKARRSYEYAFKLKEMGIDTPEAIAYIEIKENFLFSYGYFISAKCEDPVVFPALEDVEDYDKQLADEVAGFLAQIHDAGVLHGDLNLTNIMYHKNEDGHYHFNIIDTNRCKFRRKLSHVESLKDLRRVTYRRDLYEHLIKKYAEYRGLDPEYTLKLAEKALKGFVIKGKVKEFFKRLFK